MSGWTVEPFGTCGSESVHITSSVDDCVFLWMVPILCCFNMYARIAGDGSVDDGIFIRMISILCCSNMYALMAGR